jgi:exonuclease III
LSTSVRVALWNLQWSPSRSRRADIIRSYLTEAEPDIICLTEAHADFLAGRHQVEAEEDYGYPVVKDRRKVLLWSKRPWYSPDRVRSPDMPSGRYVSASTETPIGPLQVTGVCIPWNSAHVSSGRRDRTRWEDHLGYLARLAPLLSAPPARPTLLVGDYNQTAPRSSRPIRAFSAQRSPGSTSPRLA